MPISIREADPGLPLRAKFTGPVPHWKKGLAFDDEKIQDFLSDAVAGAMNVLGCSNELEVLPEARSDSIFPSLRVQSHNWQELVQELIKGANCIILFLQDLSEGVQFEIDLIRNHNMIDRCCVFEYRNKFKLHDFPHVFTAHEEPHKLSPYQNRRFKAVLSHLMSDGFKKTAKLKDLSGLDCHVVDRHIELAFAQIPNEKLAGLSYNDFLPSSLANNWDALGTYYRDMKQKWREAERSIDAANVPNLIHILGLALHCFVFAATVEEYEPMAVSLATAGMVHRLLTGKPETSKVCYAHAATFARWAKNQRMAAKFQEYAELVE